MKKNTLFFALTTNCFTLNPECLILHSGFKFLVMNTSNYLQLWRHATIFLELSGQRLLIDPMLSPQGAMDPIANSSNNYRIPMVDLPFSQVEHDAQLRTLDALFVTHLHRDHWDVAAQVILEQHTPLFCQPQDAITFSKQGFEQVVPVQEYYEWNGLKIYRTGGQHGTGALATAMGPVSGFVIKTGTLTIYIAGDTIWCPEVAETIQLFQPDWIILNGGAAQFLEGDPITMSDQDIQQVAQAAPGAQLVIVHLDTVNHCHQTRQKLRTAVSKKPFAKQVHIPADGEIITL